MKKIIALLSTLLALSQPAVAGTLLFTNSCPPAPQTDPVYLAEIASLTSAIMAGSRIHVAMQYPENGGITTFVVELTAIRVQSNYASGLLAMRPGINGLAQASSSNAMTVGSVDSLGNYVYGAYAVGGGVAPVAPTTFTCYANSWFAD